MKKSSTIMDIFEGSKIIVSQPGCLVRQGERYIGVAGVFSLWVPQMLRKCISIISKVKSRYWKRTHKYDIKIPNNYKHDMKLDDHNGTNLW